MIESAAECQAAAGLIGAPWASVAGTEWASGCLFHGGNVYYSDHDGEPPLIICARHFARAMRPRCASTLTAAAPFATPI